MSLDLEAAASLAVCLGPTEDSCVTLNIDASHTTAAGFDALAELNLDATTPLTPLFAGYDELTYEQPESCNGDLALSVGYWQYVERPAVSLTITTAALCDSSTDKLWELKSGLLQYSIDSVCIATDIL